MSEGITLDVLVQPKASRDKIGPMHDGRLKVAVTSPPVDGEANAAVIDLIAKRLHVSRSAVTVVAGASSRRKTLRIAGVTAAAIAALALGACSGEEGVLTVGITTAPGSTIMDGVQTLRMTITNPAQVSSVERSGDGFDLSIDISADGPSRAIWLEGLDAGGTVIANGQTPIVPIAAVTAKVVIYMAAPMSFGAAPVTLDPPRSQVGLGTLTYGAIVMGGADAAHVASDAVAIYNAYDHSLLAGAPLPVALASPCIAPTRNNAVFVFGGSNTSERGTLYAFSTSTPPAGVYSNLGDHPEYARACAASPPVRTNVDQFIVAGMPVLEIGGNTIAPRGDLAKLLAIGASVTTTDGKIAGIFAGTDAGYTRFLDDVPDMLAGTVATDSLRACADLGDSSIVFATPTALVKIDPIGGTIDPVEHPLATARELPALASTARHVIVAGGKDAGGLPIATAEVFDAMTLAPLATIALVVPRIDAIAVPLPNDQILLVGGVDAVGAPIATIELFTPPVP